MEHLRVELYRPHGTGITGIGGILHIGRAGYDVAVSGQGSNGVAMAHPHLGILFKALEERIGIVERPQMGTAILSGIGLLHLTAQGVCHKLSAIANAQHGQLAQELPQVYLESLGIMHGVRRAAQDDSYHRGVVLGELVVRKNLAERIQLAHSATYELRGLRTEIENDNLLLHVVDI